MDKDVPGIVDDVDTDVRAALAELHKEEPAEPAPRSEADKPEPAAEPEAGKEPDKPTGKTPRDPATGKFTKAEAETNTQSPPEAPAPPKDGEQGGSERATQGADAAAPPANRPPPGWSIAAKSAWDALPEEVRAAVAKREQEVDNGFAQLKDFKDLKPYAEMATRSGTTLGEALRKYTTAETALRSNPQQGFINIAQNLGLSQSDAAKTFLALAQQLGAQIPSSPAQQTGNGTAQPGAAADQNGAHPDLMQALQPVLAPLFQEINTLKTERSQQQQADQNRQMQAAQAVIETFASDPAHRYYPDLEPIITDLLQKGLVQRSGDFRADLAKAYEMAAWQHPEVRAALIKEQRAKEDAERVAKEKAAAAKAAAASKSVSGSPSPGDVVARQRKPGEDDLEADVRAALSQVAR